MHVQFIRAIRSGAEAQDAVAEGWVTRRGRRTVFCESEAFGASSGELLAKSVLTYAVSPPPSS
jgi:acyl-coenzyme A thioesterase PaaI-like protein